MKYPARRANAKTSKKGPQALLGVLNDVDAEAFEVPLGEDYGIDVLAQLPHLHYADTVATATIDSDQLSPWLREWVGRTVARAAGSKPESALVIGRFVGFQVKTSDGLDAADDVWTYDLKVKHLNYWSNCDFPVVLVVSSTEGELRYLETDAVCLTEKQRDQEHVTVHLSRTLDTETATSLLAKTRSDVARREALVQALGLLSPDEQEQLAAVAACWAATPDQGIMRLVRAALPRLGVEARGSAMVLLAAIIESARDIAGMAQTNAERTSTFEEIMDCLGVGGPLEYQPDEWLTLCTHWTADQRILMRVTTVRTDDAGSLAVLPDDPWPDAPPEDEVYRRARRVWNWVETVTPWDAVIVLLSRAPDPADLVEGLAIREIANDPALSWLGEKWFGITLRTFGRIAGPAPTRGGIAAQYLAAQELGDWQRQRDIRIARTFDRIVAASQGGPAIDRLRELHDDFRAEAGGSDA